MNRPGERKGRKTGGGDWWPRGYRGRGLDYHVGVKSHVAARTIRDSKWPGHKLVGRLSDRGEIERESDQLLPLDAIFQFERLNNRGCCWLSTRNGPWTGTRGARGDTYAKRKIRKRGEERERKKREKKDTNDREDLSAIDSKSQRLRLSFTLPGRSSFLLRLFSRCCFWVDARERDGLPMLRVYRRPTTLTSSCDYKRGQTPWIRITARRRFVSRLLRGG